MTRVKIERLRTMGKGKTEMKMLDLEYKARELECLLFKVPPAKLEAHIKRKLNRLYEDIEKCRKVLAELQ